MDYAGKDFFKFRYAINRPLTEEERAHRYRQQTTRDAPPMDFLSVTKLNSHYLELVDRWYPITGFQVWLGASGVFVGLAVAVIAVWASFFAPNQNDLIARLLLLLLFMSLGFALAWVGVLAMRLDAFRWTHYPMRLNRQTRQVHVFRQDGTVLTVPWDDLFITLGTAKAPLTGTTYDLRAHVLDADGKTVRESFSLGYTFPGKAESMDKFWAFLQPYMEAPDGVERTCKHLQGSMLMPLDERKEGWRWSIARTFAFMGHWPWMQLLFCVPFGLTAVGRMFAMWTSKVPRWPEEVECASEVEADDPYVLTWRDNAPLGWWELWYPLICTVLGVGTFVGVIVSMLVTMGS